MKKTKKWLSMILTFAMVVGGWSAFSAVETAAAENMQTQAKASLALPEIKYAGFIQDLGWMGPVSSPESMGTTGKDLRLEAIKIDIVNPESGTDGLEYAVFMTNQGWQTAVKNGQVAGSPGQNDKMEAIRIQFSYEYATQYNIQYRVCTHEDGWSEWYANGECAGSTGRGNQIEAIELRVNIKTYTVSFDPKGGALNGNVNSIQVTNGSNYGTLPEASKDGYKFKGWYTQENGGTQITATSTVQLTGNQTLYAQWDETQPTPPEPGTYTITLDAGKGTVSSATITRKENSEYGELPKPVRDNYVFDGWYTESTGGTLIQATTKILNKDTTIYAHWTGKEIVVSFDAKGGTVSPTSRKVIFEDKYGTLPEPKKADNTFEGWYLESDFTNKITENSIVSKGYDHTLYAKWKNGNTGNNPPEDTKVTLNLKSAVLYVGKSTTLKAVITPEKAQDQGITWSSSNESIARVSDEGKVTGIKKGTATITCKTDDGAEASCKITVKTVAVKKVTLNLKKATVKKGKKITLKAKITPTNATNKNVTWTSSNKKVATVTKKGVVKGVKKGTAVIKVKTKDGKKTATCKITVK